MVTQTQVLIVGVTNYIDCKLSTLPGAEGDAATFARALNLWGIPKKNITLLLNHSATKKHLNSYFSKLKERESEQSFHLLIYFCGHGFRTQTQQRKSYLLLHDSKVIGEKCVKGISLEELIKSANQLNVHDLYLFIDACSLRLNTIPNPKLKQELEEEKSSKSGLFCFLSSGIEPSYEDAEYRFGYFTQALLESLSKVRSDATNSPTALLENIQGKMEAQKLPLPEMYNIGIKYIDCLPKALSPYISNGLLVRPHLLSKIQDLILLSPNTTLVIHGEKGRGKKTLIKQLSSESHYIFPIKCDHTILKQLRAYQAQYRFAWILLDCTHLALNKIQTYLPSIQSMKLRVILFSEKPIPCASNNESESSIYNYELPPWTKEEFNIFIKSLQKQHLKNDLELIFLVSQGNPAKIQSLFKTPSLSSSDTMLKTEIRKAIGAICSVGLYMNEQLFCKIFNLKLEVLGLLEKMELIILSNGYFIPHELLIEIAENEKLEINKEQAIQYWSKQFYELPHYALAARNFILTLECFGYDRKFESQLKQAFQLLLQSNTCSNDDLKAGAHIFLKAQCLSETTLLVIERLIERSELELASQLLDLKFSNKCFLQTINRCKIHVMWRSGAFLEAIHCSSSIIHNLPMNMEKIQLLFHRGIAYIFLGHWDQAYCDFSSIHNFVNPSIYQGRARCMLGAINGLRGINLEESKQLLESGVQTLMKFQDISGMWAGWNNLGEILWKTGEYKHATFFLSKALEIAEQCDHPTMKLETLRNLLQVKWRMTTPHSNETTQLLSSIEASISHHFDYFTQMQLWNSLASCLFFRGEIRRAITYVKQAIPLTAQSAEYHIYTLLNLALLFSAKGLSHKAHIYLNQAKDLAKRGKNTLALHQIEADWKLHMLTNQTPIAPR